MTVLTQLSAGAFTSIWALQVTGMLARPAVTATASLVVGMIALSASTLHLGRPALRVSRPQDVAAVVDQP